MLRGFFAECPLTRLSRDFDRLGPTSEPLSPGVTARIDQHAAAIRDSIESDGHRLSRRNLTHYLRGFMDGLLERGWSSHEVDYDWETLRLVAVCRLAKEHGFVR